ncbi:MAG: metal ABC transporter permease [Gammaproteobacteria bacterium]|nr:metal ABC transporter permease [Gammaproteobacteria bacterium]
MTELFPAFLLPALLAGLALAAVAGPLGCFVVWRRMAYFGETLAHAALLGVALSLSFALAPLPAVLFVCLAVALILVVLQGRFLADDTLLGILAQGSLALGLVIIALAAPGSGDPTAWLFGEILAVTRVDLGGIAAVAALVLTALAALWRPLLAVTVHEELAAVEGRPVKALRLALVLMLALVIAVAMKVVGVLLITALLTIPAAVARRLSRTPKGMALAASAVGILAVAGGLAASLRLDSPSGPSIVVAALGLFLLSLLVPQRA